MIYFDNAATSFPKAPGVSDAMKYYIDTIGVNTTRGVYGPALEAGMKALFHPTGDLEKDLATIQAMYKGVTACHPEQFAQG